MAKKYLYVAAAWKKKGKNGDYLSFSLDEKALKEVQFVNGKANASLFPNNKKTKESQPDYNVVATVGGNDEPSTSSKSGDSDLPF